MKVEVIRDESGFRALEQEWNGLLARSDVDGVFLSWEWTTTWWDIYGGKTDLLILVAREDDGRLVGIAPLGVSRGQGLKRYFLRQLALLGTGSEVVPECLDFIVERGRESEVIDRFLTDLNRDFSHLWDVWSFKYHRPESPLLGQVTGRAGETSWRLLREARMPSPYVELPESWDAFLSGKSKKFRQQTNYLGNRLNKQHAVRKLQPGVDISLAEGFRGLISLNRQRWGEEGQSFRSPEFVLFHEMLAARLHARGALYFRLWEVDGQMAAARYDFVYAGKLWSYQGGWLPELASLSLGRLMIADSLRWCIANGLREYDFLAGEASYKSNWATHERELLNVGFTNNRRLTGALYGTLIRTRERLKRCVKPAGLTPLYPFDPEFLPLPP